jgi:protein involved in polysaccharide export with SLBB domain
VKRPNANTLMPEFIAIDGAKVLKSNDDFIFQDQDRVIILSLNDIRYLSSEDITLVLQGKMPAYGRSETLEESKETFATATAQGLAAAEHDPKSAQIAGNIGITPQSLASMKVCAGLKTLVHLVEQNGLASTPFSESQSMLKDVQVCPKLYDEYPDLLPFLFQNILALDGAVYRPGYYPVVEGGYLSDVITAAGGTLQNVDPSKIEVTLPRKGSAVRQEISLALAMADYTIGPKANIRIGRRFSDIDGGMMTISGEVRYPGRYRLMRGERLSQLIERAGGYTDQAYILGAILLRESVREQEQASYRELADQMELDMPSALQRAASLDGNQRAAFAGMLQRTIQSLRSAKAAGRIVVDATAASLQSSPENDILLQSGDRFHVPQRPSHMMVSGEVMHSGALRFIPGQSADAYIEQAGGLREGADEGRIFVILPDGSAKPISVSSWNYQETYLPPGSTIIVPKDLTPAMFWSYARDSLSIFSSIAISAAALATIND